MTKKCKQCKKPLEGPRLTLREFCLGPECKRVWDNARRRLPKPKRVLVAVAEAATDIPEASRDPGARREAGTARRAACLAVAKARGYSSLQALLDAYGISRASFDAKAKRGHVGITKMQREYKNTGKTLEELLEEAGILDALRKDRFLKSHVNEEEE